MPHLEGPSKAAVSRGSAGQACDCVNILPHSLLAALLPPGAVLVQAVDGKENDGGQHGVAPGDPSVGAKGACMCATSRSGRKT
jgi:hypothetical protein